MSVINSVFRNVRCLLAFAAVVFLYAARLPAVELGEVKVLEDLLNSGGLDKYGRKDALEKDIEDYLRWYSVINELTGYDIPENELPPLPDFNVYHMYKFQLDFRIGQALAQIQSKYRKQILAGQHAKTRIEKGQRGSELVTESPVEKLIDSYTSDPVLDTTVMAEIRARAVPGETGEENKGPAFTYWLTISDNVPANASRIACLIKALHYKPDAQNVYTMIGDLLAAENRYQLSFSYYQMAQNVLNGVPVPAPELGEFAPYLPNFSAAEARAAIGKGAGSMEDSLFRQALASVNLQEKEIYLLKVLSINPEHKQARYLLRVLHALKQ